MIKSFKCSHTQNFFETGKSKYWSNIKTVIERKLTMLNTANSLNMLRIPPNNHLEKLKDDREGTYSIRINIQYRICFRWESDGVYDVEIVDYH